MTGRFRPAQIVVAQHVLGKLILVTMPLLFRVFAVAVTVAFSGCVQLTETTPAPVGPARWPHETSDLKPDPAVTWGRLENGLRYAILPHATPPGYASVMLLVQVGSHFERRGELG